MGYCIYTSLAQYADGVLEKTGGCFGSKAPSYMLFDRILNVFGWTGVHHLTVHPGREGTQRLRYCIRIGDVRSPAFRICCMIDQTKFPHDCGYYDHLEDIMGEYEAAIKLAKRQQAAYILDLRRYIRPRVQGDGLELGADEPQQVSVAENTEVTEDAVQVSEHKESGSEDVIAEVSSTEKLHQFPDLLNRWVPIDNLKVTGDNGGKALIKSYVFPHDFFKQACVSNTLPMEQFMYGQFDFEMMLKVNSHKFQSGRLLMSAIPDPARLDVKYRQNWHTCVQRRHVFVDVANATSAVLGIPFEYHRTFVRNIEHGQSCAGVDGAKATGADIHVVSPIKAGSGQSLDCGLLVWARITNASLAGMSLRVPVVQGPVLGPVREFLSYVKGVDNMLAHVEDLTGLDKPTEVRAPMQIVPAAISHNASGKGVFLGTPLRLNPAEISTHPGRVSEALEKETMESIAKEWGYLTQVDWAVDAAAGTELLRVPLEPTWFSNQVSNTITFSAPVPPPVSAICRMMAYWTGTMDYRFDCVSSMHSGSFTVSFEFGRESGTVDKCQPYASYTHTFDLGERKTFEATAPYIFDTPVRRTATVPYYDHKALSDADHMNKYRTGLVARVNSQMFVRVANPLKAPTLASPTITLLVFVRAGHDFKLYSVIQNNGLPEWGSGVDAFPSDSYQPVIAKKGTRGTGSTIFQHREAHRGQPLGDRFTKSLTIASRALEVGSESADADKEEIKRLKDLVKTLQATSSVCQISLTESRQEAEEAEQERERLQGVIADLQSKVQVAAPTAGQPTTDRLKAELSYFKYLVSMNWPRYTQSSNKHWVNDAHFTAYSRTNASYPGAQFQVGDEVLTVTDGAHVIRTGSQLWAYYGSKGAIDATVVMWRPNAEVQVGFPLVPTEHNSIWDVLRRPVMIRSEVKLEAGKAYYVPCVPPQRGWCDEAQSVFDDLVITTPHVSIMGAFRFWRGEMRYTVINKGSRELYISHIPHSGTRMLGHTVATTGTNDVQFKSFNPAAAGLPFDVNHPAVNPITQVEVPYLTENVWCTINNGDLKQNAYWRDMMGDNTGHLVIYSPVATDVALLWAAGDRFRVGNFIGFSGQRRMRIVDTMTDDNPRVQSADFIEQDSQGDSPRPSVQGFSDYFGGVLSWGVGKSISETARSVNEAAEAVTATMTGNGAALRELLGVTQGKITDFAKGVEAFASSLTKHLGCAALGSVFVGVVVDGWVCWRTGSPGVLAAILGKWLITIGMVEVSALVPVVGAFTAYLTATSSDGNPQVQAAHTRNPGPMEKLLRAIVSLSVVCKGARVAGRAGEIVSRVLKKAKVEEMSWCIKTWEAFAGFFSGLVKLVVTIWEECMCETDPEARTLRMVTSNNDGLRKYLEDANRFLRAEANDELRTYPTSRIQFYATVAMSMRIQVCLAQNPDVRNMSLAAVARNVIQKGNDMAFELHSSPVRFEPYVVCLSGPTNIGKSYFAHRLVPSLLKQVGWKGTGDPVYVRTPGRDFWDGYTDQPVILFDDMSNIRETSQNVSTMADLFALKSSALFNPNMAKLEEKNRRGNPLIVLILTNIPFPDMSESADTAAFDRRRDVMFRVTQAKSESGEPHPKVKDCSHLLFEKYHSTIRSADGAHHVGDPMGVDQFMESIEASWAAYHARETGNVKDRVARFFSAMNREAESDWMEFDPYGVLTRCLVQASGDGAQSGKGLLEEMEMVFDTYLEQIRCQDVVDYYSKKRDQPVVQGVYHEDDAGPSYGECPGSGPDDSNPYFIPEFFEGVPASEEMPTEMRQGVLSALAEAKRLKGEYGGVDAEVNFLTSFALMAKLTDDSDKMARQRKMLGLYVGRCDGCASPDQFVFKMPCERGSTCHMLCVGCLASRDYFQCEHGVHKVSEIHASTLRVLTVVFLHLSRLAQQPVSLLLFVACRAVNTIPGFGRFVGAFTTLFGFYITLKYGFVIAGLRAIAMGTGISYISGDPQWARSIKDAYDTGFRCLIDITSVVTLLTRKLWATVKEKFGPVGLVEEPDEGNPTVQMADERDAPIIIHSVIREVMPPVLMLRENYLDRAYVVGDQTYRRCYHYEFLKPSSPNSFLGSITWADQELAVGPVSWEDGHWEHIGSDGELHTYENKACTMTTCPMRCTAIVKAMCERQPALLRHTWQANLQIGRRYDEMPAQLLPDSAYYAMRNPMTTAVKKAYDWIKSFIGYDWLTAIKRKWGESKAQVLWGLAVGGVVLYGLVRALAKLANLFTGDTEKEASTMDVIYPIFPETQQQQYDLSQQRWQKASRRTTPLKQKLGSRRAARVQGEAPAAVQLFSGHVWDMVAKIIGNVVVMKLAVGPSVVEMIGIGVAQQCILLPKHYLKNLDLAANHGASLSVVRLAMTDKVYNSCPLRADLVQLPGTDCMMWRCPNIPPFSDIRKFFPKAALLQSKAISGEAALLIPAVQGMPVPHMQPVRLREFVYDIELSDPNQPGPHTLAYGVKYNYSRTGVCGSPLIRDNAEAPLLGFHVAGCGEGARGTGWAIVLSREEVTDMFDLLVPAVQSFPAYEPIPFIKELKDSPTYEDDPTVAIMELGEVPPNKAVAQPLKTKIRKSMIADDLGITPVRVPVPLSSKERPYLGTGTSPMYEGVKHYGRLTKDMPAWFEDKVGPVMAVKLMAMPPVGVARRGPLTIEQAVTGLTELSYYDSMNLSSSPGYPWCLEHKDGKRGLINIPEPVQDGVVDIDPLVRDRVEKELAMVSSCVRPATVFCDILKDEKKKRAQVETVLGKTRLVCMSPISFTIRMRMYFLHFFAAFMRDRSNQNHSVGISVYGTEWSDLVNRLRDKNAAKFWTLDYKNFGPAYATRAGRLAMRLMIDWTKRTFDYSEDDEKQMWSMVEETLTSVHIAGTLVFQQASGSPSGDPGTTPKNSLVNIAYIRMAMWHILHPVWLSKLTPKDNASQHNFWKWVDDRVDFTTYGDDVIGATVPELEHVFNAATISRYFSTLDITASDASKGETVAPLTPFQQSEFLKCKPIPHPKYQGQWLAALPTYVVEEAAYYIWQTDDPTEATRVNAQASLMLAYGNGREYYDAWLRKLNGHLADRGIEGFPIGWDDWDEIFFPLEVQGAAIRGRSKRRPLIPFTFENDPLEPAVEVCKKYNEELDAMSRDLEVLEETGALLSRVDEVAELKIVGYTPRVPDKFDWETATYKGGKRPQPIYERRLRLLGLGEAEA